jgi:hypothetical protein
MSTAANYPMPSPAPVNSDLEHLRLLAVFHYVVAAIAALLSFVPAFYAVIGIALVNGYFPLKDVDKQIARQELKERELQDGQAEPNDEQMDDDARNELDDHAKQRVRESKTRESSAGTCSRRSAAYSPLLDGYLQS